MPKKPQLINCPKCNADNNTINGDISMGNSTIGIQCDPKLGGCGYVAKHATIIRDAIDNWNNPK